MACKYRTLVFVLFLLLCIGFTESIPRNNTQKLNRCKRQLARCSFSKKCFSRLKGLKEECDATASPRFEKSLYSKESLYFAPHIYMIDSGVVSKNWTYSVFLGDDRAGNNLTLVDNCCNLRKGDTCDMPATFNKNKAFFVIFPYNMTNSRKLYCFHRVPYKDAPIDMCEEGKPIIDSCIDFDNGDFKLKYQHKPLQPGQEFIVLSHNGCYGTIRSDMLPDNTTIPYNQQSPTEICPGLLTMSPRRKRSTDDQTIICKLYFNVSSKNYETIIKDALDSKIGDIVCFKVETFLGPGKSITSRPMFCQRVKINVRPLKVWQVAVPITAFACLIILIGYVRFYRLIHEIRVKITSGVNLTKDDDSPTTESHTSISTNEDKSFVYVRKVKSGYKQFYPIHETEGSAAIDQYYDVTPGSADSQASDGESGEVSSLEADEKDSLKGTTRIASEDEADNVSTTLRPMMSCANDTPYIRKDFEQEEAEKADSIESEYVKKHFNMNISMYMPSTNGYISKYLKKNVRARSPTTSDACS